MLEMDDAINNSGFNAYNVFYSLRHLAGDEVMLRNIVQFLQTKFPAVHFVYMIHKKRHVFSSRHN